ncbi:ATP-binding protein [Oculatella sp. FACHB-28]|uniref:AAA family ATPase n=1 Tax=Oculatella sp. FACHB-28 TaxID=2692845 RepID=UPI001688E642|nr:ATP-binding protein [Oculatella sp. FACHB-28]MBD2057647.1 ATP-binding protein [Oculatella sp. FACHB-28]
MPIQAERFVDNWAYLKTELQWLDRVLMLAVARQRQETKEVDRFSQSRADRATSHWWKGIMSFKENIAYDEHRPPAQSTGKTSSLGYQQQLEHRIQVSREQGIFLGLPSLRDRLNLTLFEKNLVLLGLAPEINRRYAKIYRYLQGDDIASKTDLPTVDLVLRLLCRNDVEWRAARIHLTTASPLLQHNLLKLLAAPNDTVLNYPVKLADPLVDYLLAEQPTTQALDCLLSQFIAPPLPALLSSREVNTTWTDLILPEPLHNTLQLLGQQVQYARNSNLIKPADRDRTGTLALLVGATGTGKTTAAEAIAHSLDLPLWEVDLSRIDPTNSRQLFEEIEAETPEVLLIHSAHLWLGRSSSLPQAEIHRFLDQRQQTPAITLLTAPFQQSVRLSWQRRLDRVLEFSLPSQGDRLKLWQQFLSTQVPLDRQIDWEHLAQLKLTGGEIEAIAYDAALNFAASDDTTLSMSHLIQALEQSGKSLTPKSTKRQQNAKQVLKNVSRIADPVKDEPVIQDEPITQSQPAKRKSPRKSSTRESTNSANSTRKNSKQAKDNIA